ncbi:MAG: cobaltochelatase subunit CobN [Pseudomonadales bacterium]|nr:cobaltochelatase subunit CobN [Pseudomonadales bacterium]
MHLLAAQPGGFSDEEGIVDLGQSAGDIVVLSAADSALSALASAVDQLPQDFPSVRLANWMQLVKPAALDLYLDKTLADAQVVLVSLLGGSAYWQYGFEQLLAWQQQSSSRQLILVPGDDAEDLELMQSSSVSLEAAQRIWRYLRQGGAHNNRQLFLYLADQYLSLPQSWAEPEYLPQCLLYMPQSPLKHSQASFFDWQQRWQQQLSHSDQPSQADMPCDVDKPSAADKPSRTIAVLLFYRSHLQSANTGLFDALIQALEAAGVQVLPIAIASLKDPESITLVNALITESDAGLVINTTGFASNTVSSPELSSTPTAFESPFTRDIPVLQLVLSSSTEQDWQNYSQGLRARDIAMQVVLPEMDGRVVTRAVSFKAESHWSERCEIAVVRYQAHHERCQFVAELAKRYLSLAAKPNQQKRLAIILANYPTKDGRIGNGVGLDTPNSTVNFLHALADAGYPLDDLPEDGDALIRALLTAVTNNPSTLHYLPCWQSIALDSYRSHFAQLPLAAQQAVISRWGQPEQDPKCRHNRIMLAGIRLGETFIGIQPARGFNVDLLANYHDPDLVPPHSYLAFYFWLRFEYQVDAVVHMGKHGNLEWLPGKGSALSEQCWPDIALGPMPHFYPFIVNDPGEGAQAKRRCQAVIIDHLMPPMTRAEVYGELAALEALVDEYYQAMSMDSRRESWLREQIIDKVTKTNILSELDMRDDESDDAQLLDQLDTYLCDIKEAQIRHGLHILGQLPDAEKLSDTIVALLRLPRGSAPEAQGILNALVNDLNIQHQSAAFDPLQLEVEPWDSPCPPLLQQLSDRPWRTTADTRERLELLALQWVEQYVLGDYELRLIQDAFPHSYQLLEYAREVLLPALETSVENEVSALTAGLAGRFVEPGPSGAPTRGRLDTLPTGRNFYSLDNRSIPSPAAWAIGQRSADALIARHLQDHGDYPKQLGLSVWGTATMRTGGDDIAQAFALMGIKPIWAPGSQRVVDFEIIPCMLLGRPRIDVTLRVSGFFRDAFPNVMRLYDAAVTALIDYDEPAHMNTIQANIIAAEAEWLAQGDSAAAARRKASYRVYGSKPGAYGAGLQGLIDERCWQSRDDLAEAYVNWGGYAYGNDQASADGVEAKQSFTQRLSQLEAVVQNQDNREHDILDSDDYYQFQGGMTNAVAVLSGSEPTIYHNDHANPAKPVVRTLKQELNRVMRSRVLNPKWIEAMQAHGYKGAFEMAASVDYIFAYDATTNLIDDYQYRDLADQLLFDEQNQAFLSAHNPAALTEMAERLLEACQRGMWQDSQAYEEQLRDLLLSIDARQEQSMQQASE